MYRQPRPNRSIAARIAAPAVVVLALIVGLSACSGSSSDSKAASSPTTTLAAALQLQQQGNLSAAKQLYEKVILTQPSNVFAQYDLGVIAQQQGDGVDALVHYGAALTANPKYVPALYNEATIYAATDPALAITIYRQVISLQPVAPTAKLNLGLLEIKQGEPKLGVEDLGKAVAEDPSLLSKLPKHLQTLVKALAPGAKPTGSNTPMNSPSSSTSSSP